MGFSETVHWQEERPNMPISLLVVLYTLWLECQKSMKLIASWYAWYAFSMFVVSGGGNLPTDSLVRRQKCFQSDLRKFQYFTGLL